MCTACLSVRCRMKPDQLMSIHHNKAYLGVYIIHRIGAVLMHPAAARYEHERSKSGSTYPMLPAVLLYGVVYRPYEEPFSQDIGRTSTKLGPLDVSCSHTSSAPNLEPRYGLMPEPRFGLLGVLPYGSCIDPTRDRVLERGRAHA